MIYQNIIDRHNKNCDSLEIYMIKKSGVKTLVEIGPAGVGGHNENFPGVWVPLHEFIFNQGYRFAKNFVGDRETFYYYDEMHRSGETLGGWKWGLRAMLAEMVEGRDILDFLENFEEEEP